MTTIIVGVVCFGAGLLTGIGLICLVSIDRVNREQRGNTYE